MMSRKFLSRLFVVGAGAASASFALYQWRGRPAHFFFRDSSKINASSREVSKMSSDVDSKTYEGTSEGSHVYEGGCLCEETTYVAKGEPDNPHLCSCTMCQKASGALTTTWAAFPQENFEWTGKKPGEYQSSESVIRFFCKSCGGPLATIEGGVVDIATGSLNDSSQIVPNADKHSFKTSAPSWWAIRISDKQNADALASSDRAAASPGSSPS